MFERIPAPAEAWLLYAKAFAEIDKMRSLKAFKKAYAINHAILNPISPSWHLADLLKRYL